MPNKDDELGGLWIRQGRSGDFLSGKIGDQEVVIFPNAYKKPGERTPDWRVYKSQPREGGGAPRQEYLPPSPSQRQMDNAYRAQAPDGRAPGRSTRPSDDRELDDDIPF